MFGLEARPLIPRTARVRVGADSTRAERFQHARSVLAPLAFEPAAKQQFAAIGEFESLYGIAGAFAGTFNWGALVGEGTAGSIVANDHDKNGKLVSVHFKKFTTALEGLQAFLRTVIHPGTGQEGPAIAEFNSGDARAVATRMFKNGYYVGFGSSDAERIDGYVKAIVDTARAYAISVGETPLVNGTGGGTYTPAGGGGGGVVELPPVIITAEPKSDGNGLLVAGALAAAGAIAWRAFR